MMTSMAVTIPVGVILLWLLYLVFYRWTPLNARQSGFVISLLALAFYLPYALIYWPGADVLALNITIYFMAAYLMGMFFSHREKMRQDESASRNKWFHWAPALIVSFFIVILVVDAVFVTLSKEGLPGGLQSLLISKEDQSEQSLMRFPGVMHNNYHKKEARYNNYLRQLELLQSRGWKIRKGWLGTTPAVDQQGVFQVVVEDQSGKKIPGMKVSGRFMHAADGRYDVEFAMHEQATGVYRADMKLARPGLWNVNIDIIHGDEVFEIHASTRIEARSSDTSIQLDKQVR